MRTPPGRSVRILLFHVDACVHLQDSAKHLYVEVVLHGQTKRKFPEDPEAHSDEMIGQVPKLVAGGQQRV